MAEEDRVLIVVYLDQVDRIYGMLVSCDQIEWVKEPTALLESAPWDMYYE